MKKNTLFTIGGIVGVALLLMFSPQIINRFQKNGPVSVEVSPEDHIKGAASSTVTLIEYSDFQCPACASYFPTVKSLVEKHANSLQFAYRHFPITNLHPYALPAGIAAEAAGKQGKFFEMHDMLFENQNEWTNESANEKFLSYGEMLSLDIDQFKKDLRDASLRNHVEKDLQKGMSLGVNATPTFFLNGVKISPRTPMELVEKVEKTLEKPLEKAL